MKIADGIFEIQDGMGSQIKVEGGTITVRRGTRRRVYDTNAFGEERHHPYYDAPEERLAAAGRLSINQPPPEPTVSFIEETDFDAPIERQIAARGWAGRGDCTMAKDAFPEYKVPSAEVRCVYDTNAFGENRHHPYYDAPEERLAAAGRLSINQPPPEPTVSFIEETDFDAPIERQIAARGWAGRGDCR